MISNTTKCDIDQRAFENTPTLVQKTIGLKVSTPTILVTCSSSMPRHSGRVIVQLNQFMYFGDSFKVIPKEHKINPTNNNEEMSSDDVILW